MNGIVVEKEDISDFIQESGLLTFAGGGHSIFLQSRYAVGLIIGIGQNGPKIRFLSYYQRKDAC